MASLLFILGFFIAPLAPVAAQGFIYQTSGLHQQALGGQIDNGLLLEPATTYLGAIRPNAYGSGINADAAGRPLQWQPDGIHPTGPNPTLKATPNAEGMGVHADQYGRIAQLVCPFG